VTTSKARSTERPIVAVLCRPDEPQPDVAQVADRLELRFTDAAGLNDAVFGARSLFLWDFFSSAVRDVWSDAGALEWIHVAAAGVDTLLFDELAESDVVVTNARGVFDRPIAEFVLASILAQLKQLHLSRDLQRERVWRHRETETLATQRALVVGTGAIGREIGRVLRSLGVQVRGAGRTARASDPDFDEIVESERLADHVGWADHVVVVAPLTEQTRGLVDGAVFAAMRPGAHLINVGRGPIVDEDALLRSLDAGHLGAASLDVFSTEPLPADNPLWAHPSVVISPHMSGDFVGWRDTLARQFVDNAERWLAGRPLTNVVDKRLGFVPPSSQHGSPASAASAS
jgi:phosphoglycerate dehydrogenase-like enzyme